LQSAYADFLLGLLDLQYERRPIPPKGRLTTNGQYGLYSRPQVTVYDILKAVLIKLGIIQF
jgi:hypothetical protein